MSLRPVRAILLVRPDPEEERSGGIILPDQARERPRSGEVVAAGPEAREVGEGDRVVYSKWAGVEVGDGLLAMGASDVIAVEVG